MDIDSISPQEAPSRRRSAWLSFLILLTIINTLISLAVLAASVFNAAAFFISIPVLDTLLIEDSAGGWMYLLAKLLAAGATLAGAVYMWKLKRIGFWYYLSAQVFLLSMPFLFLLDLGMGYLLVRLLVNSIFALLFVFLYLLQLKNMN